MLESKQAIIVFLSKRFYHDVILSNMYESADSPSVITMVMCGTRFLYPVSGLNLFSRAYSIADAVWVPPPL